LKCSSINIEVSSKCWALLDVASAYFLLICEIIAQQIQSLKLSVDLGAMECFEYSKHKSALKGENDGK